MRMKFFGKIPFFIVAVSAWIVIISSCANQGMPTGGPRDSIPPVLVETNPKYKALNYSGDDVRLTFSEYINSSGISEELVVSPPLTKRPIIQTKSRTLIIRFNEELLDSVTYSLDFKNSVVDNNENNPIKNCRFSFSTGDVYDSLRIAGRVINGFNLEPVEKALVLLQKNLHDSAVFKLRPSYIAKTDEDGLFMIDNIASGKYNVFAINDANSDLMYNEGSEEIAFWDSIIVPKAHFHEELDTLVKGVDSMLIMGHTHFYPEPIYLRQFTEDIFEQYLDSYQRKTRYSCQFYFNESVKDTFQIRLLNTVAPENWYILEPNLKMDSLEMWIADTLVANLDTLIMEVSYFQLDSMNQLYVQKDTLDMNFKDSEEKDSKRKRKPKEDEEDEPEPIPQFNWRSNISGTFELNNDILLISPEPLKEFDTSKISLVLSEDTTETPLKIVIEKDSLRYRTYRIKYNWEPETKYAVKIDSAAAINIYGMSSKELNKKFETREEDYYGKIILELSNVTSPMIAQLLENNENENVIREKTFHTNGTVVFDYLKPEKYKVKIIFDTNGNGKWDNGSYQDKFQPESVAYINKVIKVRSNWDNEFPWEIKPDSTFAKNVVDQELEEQKRKEAEEKARKEREQQNSGEGQNNFMQGGSGRSGSNAQMIRQ